MNYIEFEKISKDRENYLGINQFGYGLNISTPYKVTCNGKTYRLKASCISNNISYWIKKQGEKL